MYDQNCNKTLNGGQPEGHSGAGGTSSPTLPFVKGCPAVPLLPSLLTQVPQVLEPGTWKLFLGENQRSVDSVL